MKRSGPLRRKAVLRAEKPLKRVTRLRARSGRVPNRSAWHDEILGLAGGYCQAQLAGCSLQATDAHHRLETSQGGPDSAANGLGLCRPCHGWIHAHPEAAYASGLLIRSWEGPPASRWDPRSLLEPPG